jgi:short-subunit dehydrogenase
LRATGVTVTALFPGPTATNFASTAKIGDTALFTAPMMSVMKPAAVGPDHLVLP